MKYATTSGPDADALAGQARHRLSADEAAEREQALERYILDHISAEDPYLYRLYRATHTRLLRPRMASGQQTLTLTALDKNGTEKSVSRTITVGTAPAPQKRSPCASTRPRP